VWGPQNRGPLFHCPRVLPAQGRCSFKRICRVPSGWGPSRGTSARARAFGWVFWMVKCGWFPGGKPRLPRVLGGTGWIRLLGASPGLICLACLFCLFAIRTDACTLTPFGAGGRLDWLPITPSLFPFPPVDRCGHTRVSPKTLGVGQCQGQRTVLEAKMR
jgi:hypothetical protein